MKISLNFIGCSLVFLVFSSCSKSTMSAKNSPNGIWAMGVDSNGSNGQERSLSSLGIDALNNNANLPQVGPSGWALSAVPYKTIPMNTMTYDTTVSNLNWDAPLLWKHPLDSGYNFQHRRASPSSLPLAPGPVIAITPKGSNQLVPVSSMSHSN